MAILLRTEGRLARVTLARPPLNVLDIDHLEVLAETFERCGEAAVVVVDGGPAKCFSAGNDVRDHSRDRAPRMLKAFHRAIRALLALDAITVADVKGDALGGGCELALACDLVYAAPAARFGQPEVDVGCFPPVAAALLPQRVGWGRAVEMIALGGRVDAATAERWGLVTRVSEEGAEPFVRALLEKSPEVLRAAKAALRARTLEAAERLYLERLLPLEDCAEGVRAFLEKRPPEWRGR